MVPWFSLTHPFDRTTMIRLLFLLCLFVPHFSSDASSLFVPSLSCLDPVMSVAVSEACSKVCPQRGFYNAIVILDGQELYQVAPLRDTFSYTMPLLSKHQPLLLFFEDTVPLKRVYSELLYTYNTPSSTRIAHPLSSSADKLHRALKCTAVI